MEVGNPFNGVVLPIGSKIAECLQELGLGMKPVCSGRGGGGALPALVPSCVGHVCRPPINLLHYCKVLLD
jgi:hypothetical protein